jgi:hypothetical protein
MGRVLVLGTVGACLAACNLAADHPDLPTTAPPTTFEGGFIGPTKQVPPSSTTTYVVKVGAKVPIEAGISLEYEITADAPKSYQFRWTGNKKQSGAGVRFFGAVYTSGKFTAVSPGNCGSEACALEPGDAVTRAEAIPGGEWVEWSATTYSGFDGFSFVVDKEPVYFDVFLGDKRSPAIVSFPQWPSGAPATVSASPFGVTSMGKAVTDASADAPADGMTEASADAPAG